MSSEFLSDYKLIIMSMRMRAREVLDVELKKVFDRYTEAMSVQWEQRVSHNISSSCHMHRTPILLLDEHREDLHTRLWDLNALPREVFELIFPEPHKRITISRFGNTRIENIPDESAKPVFMTSEEAEVVREAVLSRGMRLAEAAERTAPHPALRVSWECYRKESAICNKVIGRLNSVIE